MSVYKPKNSRFWHYDFQYEGRRFYGSTGQDTKRAAETVERAKRLEAASGSYNDAGKMTIEMAANRYWLECCEFKASAKSIQRRLRVMMTCVGPHLLLREIDAAIVTQAIAKRRGLDMGRGLPSRSTVNRDIIDTTLRPIMNRARRVWGAKNVADIDWKELRFAEPEPEHREYSKEQIEAWSAELDPVLRFALRLFLRYGFRLGEIERLPPECVDGEGQRVTILGRHRKKKNPLIIPLLEEDARILAAMASVAKAADLPYVFHRGSPPENYPHDGIGRRLRAAAVRAGLTMGRVVHGARHHAGTNMLRETGNLKLAQALLGHASIQSTVRYAHANEDDLRRALSDLSRNSPEVELDQTDKPLKIKGESND